MQARRQQNLCGIAAFIYIVGGIVESGAWLGTTCRQVTV